MELSKGVLIDLDDGSGLIPIGKSKEGTVVVRCQCKLLRVSKRGKKVWSVPSGLDLAWSAVTFKNEQEIAKHIENAKRWGAVARAKSLCCELFPKLLYEISCPNTRHQRIFENHCRLT